MEPDKYINDRYAAIEERLAVRKKTSVKQGVLSVEECGLTGASVAPGCAQTPEPALDTG